MYFSGRATKKGGGGKTPLTTKQKNNIFFITGKHSRQKYEPLRGGGGNQNFGVHPLKTIIWVFP